MRNAVYALVFATLTLAADDEALTSASGAVKAKEAGLLLVLTADRGPVRFAIDRRSMIERDRKVITIDSIEPGDQVEILWRRAGDVQLAQLIKVVAWKREPRPVVTAKMLLPYGADQLVPRGRLTFSGVVTRLDAKRLTMRTRAGEEKQFQLRRDTRYKQGGSAVDAAALSTSTRVFVRAGMSLDDQLEIYEVIWGEIVAP